MTAQTAPAIEPLKSSITVVEKISAEAPASISVFERKEIREVPGVNLDDRLRVVPGFSLFRRNSSLVAHPTTQGVTLRGLGASGTSRTLVLWDGIPANDPFGGWVYWTRFAPDELERIEISRGASTSVFGDRALGGAIALFSREPQRRHLHASYEFGNRNTHEASLGFSQLWSRFAASAQGRAYTTNGYFIVPEPLRGTADREAGVRFVAADSRLDFLGVADRLFFKLDLLAEDRANGTLLQRNSTSLGTLSAHYHHEGTRDGVSLVGFHTREEFHSSFSSVAANRNSERISFLQAVPSEAVGAAAHWRHRHAQWNSLAGADVQRVEGFSTDTFSPTDRRTGGGIQLQHGVFGQFDLTAGRARFFLGARHHVTGSQGNFFSPSAGLTFGLGRLRARGSVYRAFRAPTLNELFREFRQGNIVTQANPDLRPETLFGSEAGFDLVGESRRASVTVYRNSLDGLITNVTIPAPPGLTVRQRRNAAAALTRGVEFQARQSWRNLRGEIGYLFADSRLATGERIAQVPRHHGSAQLTYARGGSLASVGLRTFSNQFDDDRNTPSLLLPGFAVVHLTLRQRLSGPLSALWMLENAGSRIYYTGFASTAPRVPTIGAPRLWRVGLRWN